MKKPQVSVFPAELTTALYRRAIASAWRAKCKHPGKPNHSLLEIFRHTDYVP
jgi:hypothetical protein